LGIAYVKTCVILPVLLLGFRANFVNLFGRVKVFNISQLMYCAWACL
jgi:hypothetical protein